MMTRNFIQPEVNIKLTQEEATALIQLYLLNTVELDNDTEQILARKIRDISRALEQRPMAAACCY